METYNQELDTKAVERLKRKIVIAENTNLRTKNLEFGFTISWFFQRGKENHSAKSLENSDVDSGEFRF